MGILLHKYILKESNESWSGRKAQRCAVNSEVAAVDCVREGVTQVAVVSWPAKQTHREQEQCSFA